MSVVVNPQQFMNGLDKEVKRVDDMMRVRVRKLMEQGMIRMLRRTPVNTGQAAMNYVASSGAPYTGPVKKAGAPVEATNRLSLGTESLRGGAEAISKATLASVDYTNPYQTFFISNRSPNISGLEHGELPKSPYIPRSPAGMFAITAIELMALLKSGKI